MAFARAKSEQEVFTLPPVATALEAAQALGKLHVGAIVVAGPDRRPVGIVTDRDIIMRVVAAGLDARMVSLDKIMSKNIVTAREGQDPLDIAVLMSERGIRRVPIVGDDGRVAGMMTFDDLIALYGHGLSCLSHALARQRIAESPPSI